MSKQIPEFKVQSLQDALNLVPDLVETFSSEGILLIRGHKFSTEEQVEFSKSMGDLLNWSICSDATQHLITSALYTGGHSDQPDLDYDRSTKDQYVLNWHIEQVYYIHPILAGVWNMEVFKADSDAGNTRFVDSIELFSNMDPEDQKFLSKSVVIWDKQIGIGEGPFYTKAVDNHPISGAPTLRVETDVGCSIMPELYEIDGTTPTDEQKEKFTLLIESVREKLYEDTKNRYTQYWQEGDVLIVDLFRMYHALMGGFFYKQRKYTGLGIRPKLHDQSLHTSMEVL